MINSACMWTIENIIYALCCHGNIDVKSHSMKNIKNYCWLKIEDICISWDFSSIHKLGSSFMAFKWERYVPWFIRFYYAFFSFERRKIKGTSDQKRNGFAFVRRKDEPKVIKQHKNGEIRTTNGDWKGKTKTRTLSWLIKEEAKQNGMKRMRNKKR